MSVRTRLIVAAAVAVVIVYSGLVGVKGVLLLGEGSPIAVLLGLALLVLPPIALLLVWRELQFGRSTARLGLALEEEGGLPVDDLPRRPSGRVDRAAADARFALTRAEVEADPGSWRAWYRLALAYDASGDRTKARAAARHAVRLAGRAPREAR